MPRCSAPVLGGGARLGFPLESRCDVAAPAGFVWTDHDAPVCVDVIAVPDPETVNYRAHLELATTSAAHHAAEAARLKALGATSADVGQGDVSWIVLADPEGNDFCVLASGDS